MRCYVIASYSWAPQVRAIHDRLRTMGVEPTSQWAEGAHGPEDLDSLTDDECQSIWLRNVADLAESDAVIALLDSPMREGWMELGRAMREHKTCLLVGRHALTTRVLASVGHSGVTRFDSVDAALNAVAAVMEARHVG